MESSNLAVVLHSGKGLKNVKHLSPMKPYAIAWIDGDGNQPKRQTAAAKKGGSDPEWDSSMNFNNVSKNENYNLIIQIKHDGKVFDRNIGEVKVPFPDLLARDASGDKVSYQVTIPSGEIKGEVILSYKFSGLSAESDEESGTGGDAGGNKERLTRKIAKKTGIAAGEGCCLMVVDHLTGFDDDEY